MTFCLMAISTSNFYPRPPRGGRPEVLEQQQETQKFLSTPSARRATTVDSPCAHCQAISIHALREEGDRSMKPGSMHWCNFYPRPPRGGRLDSVIPGAVVVGDFYPRPPRGGRPGVAAYNGLLEKISIHALREEGDSASTIRTRRSYDFYPRPPRGGRLPCSAARLNQLIFLSTPSARRAT